MNEKHCEALIIRYMPLIKDYLKCFRFAPREDLLSIAAFAAWKTIMEKDDVMDYDDQDELPTEIKTSIRIALLEERERIRNENQPWTVSYNRFI